MSIQLLHGHCPGKSTAQKPCFMSRCTAALLVLGTSTLCAQPDLPVEQLLFEPVPIPAGGAENTERFNSLENMPALISAEEIEGRGLSGQEYLEITSAIEDYVEAIGNKEADEGPYSDQLVQDLFSAGLLSQEIGEHRQAINFFERSRNISRINGGPNTLDQIPAIKAKTESQMALGLIREADDAQDGLLEIYTNSFGEGSEEVVPALRDLGDWNMRAFLERSNIALISERMDVRNFMLQSLSTGGTAADLVLNQKVTTSNDPIYKLFLAQNNYLQAISILLENRNYTHPDLMDLERQLLTTSFLRTHQENIVYDPDFYLERKTEATGTRLDTSSLDILDSEDYEVGLQSLKRSLVFISNNPERTHEQVANAMLAEADWHMLFERKVVGRRKYLEIYEFFMENPDFIEYAEQVIFPEVPVVLPTFLPGPNSREKLGIDPDGQVSYFGYFDVSFSINRAGKTRRMKITGQGGEVTRNMEIRLGEYLRKILFRPRFDREGKLDTGEIRLRYYVGV